VTAFLTSASFAPGYSLRAVLFGTDWGTTTLGISMKLSRDATGVATFVSQVDQQSLITYGRLASMSRSRNVMLNCLVATKTALA
jgi:hypothetical protein